MATTVKTGWLKDTNGDKFAPKTLVSQVQTSDGILLENKIQADLNAFKDEVLDSVANVAVETDNALSSTSTNPVANKVLKAKFDEIDNTLDGKVPNTRKVNGKALSSDVTLSASDVGALPSTTKIPSKTSELTNDKGFITSYTETDPTVPSWAKASSKPTYTKSEVGLGNVDNVKQYSASNPPPYPVTKVNNKTGAVSLTASDVGADASGTASSAVSAHNSSTSAHADIREELSQLSSEIVDIKVENMQQVPLYAESLEWLEANGDQSKMYVLPDGMIWAWMLTEKEVESGGGYTNALDGTTKHINQRWSRSSKTYTTANGYMATDLIPVTAEQMVYVNLPRIAFLGNYARIHYLDASKNYVSTRDNASGSVQELTTDANSVTSWKVGYEIPTGGTSAGRLANADSITQMVIIFNIAGVKSGSASDTTAITEADVANLIVSIDNPIEEGGTEIVTEEGWASTGHAFVPADYEPRIIALENKTLRHTAEIAELQKAVENGGAGDANESAALTRIKEWDKPVYDNAEVTLLSDDRVKPALTTSDRTIAAIYAKYRALMAAHPNYITETNMGKSASSDTFTAVDMLRFDFKEPDGLTQPDLGAGALHETKPTIIFLSGIHTEWVGVWGLYYALEEITTNPAFDDVRRNAHIVVIPCANPFCLTSQTAIDGWRMSHVNANGVAIHNNFGVDHSTSGSVGEYNYGGTAPYSEPETQYINAVMAEYPDAVAFVSCHNNDYSTYYGSHVIWASSATYHMCNMAFRLVDKLSKAWIDKYGDTLKTAIDQYKINMDADDYRLGRATMSSSKGTEQKNATKYGIQGVNLEISRMMKVFSGNTDGTSEVMTHGAEVYANFMRTLLAAYDHNDKKDYAPNLPWKG